MAKGQRVLLALTAAGLAVTAACAANTTGADVAQSKASPQPAGTTTPAPSPRPAGPAADLSQQLTGGNGVYIGSAAPNNLDRLGYVQHEYAAAGTATSYTAATLPTNGEWNVTPAATAPYRTRVLVREPASAAAFSGNVVVEWLNVSGGVDSDPDWASLYEEIVRNGDIWVGVSAQAIGVNGGTVAVKVNVPGSDQAGKGLKAIDPARYGSLQHPGDAYSYDIFTQVARGLRTGAALSGMHPQRLIAAGESQSAFAMVTYYDGIQPLTHEFDGFFVHSRGAPALPLAPGPGKGADIASALAGKPTLFRTDQTAPIMDIQTETDVSSVLSSYAVRQPDTDKFRLWEVAGTSHADAHLVGSNSSSFDCGAPINNGPLHLVAKAALRALTTWLQTGQEPLIAPRLDVKPGATPTLQRNSDGIALGGIRTPPVDVPVATLSGAPGPDPSTICLLVGSAKPLSAARLAELYPTRSDYLQKYQANADKTIQAGFVLPQDRAALRAFAEPSKIPS
jgi:hypothetical protein